MEPVSDRIETRPELRLNLRSFYFNLRVLTLVCHYFIHSTGQKGKEKVLSSPTKATHPRVGHRIPE